MLNDTWTQVPVDKYNQAIIKDEDLCSNCGNCLAVCSEEIGNITKYIENGMKDKYTCLHCGQCTLADRGHLVPRDSRVPRIRDRRDYN